MILGTLKDLRAYINYVFEGLLQDYVPNLQIQGLEDKLRGHLALESLLIVEAADEPKLWR